jgi:hypothetical protein
VCASDRAHVAITYDDFGHALVQLELLCELVLREQRSLRMNMEITLVRHSGDHQHDDSSG